MVDFLLGLFFAGLLVRGWLRGFAREAMDLAGLVVGIALAFRFSGPVGDWLGAWLGVSAETGRLAGGIVVFLIVGFGAAVGAHYLQKVLTMPGLALANRLFGSGLALAWGLFLAMLVLSLMVVVPMPSLVAGQIEDSNVATALTDPEAPAQRLFQTVAGDRVLEALLNLDRLVGQEKVILEQDETLTIPPADPDELRAAPELGADIFDLVNRSRIEEGLDPLSWSEALARVGEGHATELYVAGYFSHTSPETGTVADRVTSSGMRYRLVGENLALAATARTVHQGLMDSPSHRANILGNGYTRLGIGVVRGPLGLMVVQVFTG